MTSEIDNLQERVDAIRATGNAELASRIYLALGRELRAFARKTLKRKRFPLARRVNQTDIDWLLSDLSDRHENALGIKKPEHYASRKEVGLTSAASAARR